jgi:hypothetical protein
LKLNLTPFLRGTWPQPVHKLATSVIDEPTAAAYYLCILVENYKLAAEAVKGAKDGDACENT